MCRGHGVGGNLGLRGDGINISTSAIVVTFLNQQISVGSEMETEGGSGGASLTPQRAAGMEKSKTCGGKTLADSEMKTILGEWWQIKATKRSKE